MTLDEMKEVAIHLLRLQKEENDGRGISCVRSIAHHLDHGDFESAINVRLLEGDKTRSYPKVEKELTRIFGCRLHSIKDCNNWLCKEVSK